MSRPYWLFNTSGFCYCKIKFNTTTCIKGHKESKDLSVATCGQRSTKGRSPQKSTFIKSFNTYEMHLIGGLFQITIFLFYRCIETWNTECIKWVSVKKHKPITITIAQSTKVKANYKYPCIHSPRIIHITTFHIRSSSPCAN